MSNKIQKLEEKIKEVIILLDDIQNEYKTEQDIEGYYLWNSNDKLLIFIKSQLNHLITMIKSHELDIR